MRCDWKRPPLVDEVGDFRSVALKEPDVEVLVGDVGGWGEATPWLNLCWSFTCWVESKSGDYRLERDEECLWKGKSSSWIVWPTV